jgi:hypothetical protein
MTALLATVSTEAASMIDMLLMLVDPGTIGLAIMADAIALFGWLWRLLATLTEIQRPLASSCGRTSPRRSAS